MNIIFIIVGILIITITSILPTIKLFKQKISLEKCSKLKWTVLYALTVLIYIILFISASIIYMFNSSLLDTCGNMCQNYTNSLPNIIIGLLIYTIISKSFYIISKKIIVKFHNNITKLKYLILIIYCTINYSISIFGYYIFGGFLGKFIIDNFIINIIRWIIIFEPILIYPIDIFIISNIRKRSK